MIVSWFNVNEMSDLIKRIDSYADLQSIAYKVWNLVRRVEYFCKRLRASASLTFMVYRILEMQIVSRFGAYWLARGQGDRILQLQPVLRSVGSSRLHYVIDRTRSLWFINKHRIIHKALVASNINVGILL